MDPGGFLSLQNWWRVAMRAAVGSTPIHSRLVCQQRGAEMDAFSTNETIDLIVRRVFAIEDVTSGGKDFLVPLSGSPDCTG